MLESLWKSGIIPDPYSGYPYGDIIQHLKLTLAIKSGKIGWNANSYFSNQALYVKKCGILKFGMAVIWHYRTCTWKRWFYQSLLIPIYLYESIKNYFFSFIFLTWQRKQFWKSLVDKKKIQQRLIVLLHAHKCTKLNGKPGETAAEFCKLPMCGTIKSVLQHLYTCQEGETCLVTHCSSSRKIIEHWKKCNSPQCQICCPLKCLTPWDLKSHINQDDDRIPVEK